MKTTRLALLPALALAAATCAPAAHAITVNYYNASVTSAYTLADGQIHQLLGGAYRIFDLGDNGYIDNFGSAPGWEETDWDGFGTYDKTNGIFYAASSPESGTASLFQFQYTSTLSQGEWNAGSANIQNGYAGATYNGSLYFSGLREPYDPLNPPPNFLSRFDSATGQRHLLVETGGYSASLVFADNGDLYYATNGLGQNGLYRWDAAALAAVDNDNDSDFLDLSDDATDHILDFDGFGANGLVIDAAGNIIFASSDYVAVVDLSAPGGYRILLDAEELAALLGIDVSDVYIGHLAIEGDLFAGAELLLSPAYGANLIGIQIPEPTTYALIAGLTALLLVAYLRRPLVGGQSEAPDDTRKP